MGTLDEVKGLIKNPPKEYRSAPFWGWNDRLQRENLGEQIEAVSYTHLTLPTKA